MVLERLVADHFGLNSNIQTFFYDYERVKMLQRTQVSFDWPCRTELCVSFPILTQQSTVLRLWLFFCACPISLFKLVSLCVQVGLTFCCCCSSCVTVVGKLWKKFMMKSLTSNCFHFSSPVDSFRTRMFSIFCFSASCNMTSNAADKVILVSLIQNLSLTIKWQRSQLGGLDCA